MAIFTQSGFETGSWAGPLAKKLREMRLIPQRNPKARLYRGTWTHWIQVEPANFTGPAHWIGKPAVMAREQALYAGYYVERGYVSHSRPEYVITPEWHWYAFLHCIEHERYRRELDALMQRLDSEHRCLALFWGADRTEPPYQDESTLTRFAEITRACSPDEWIDVFLGIRMSLDECLRSQEEIRYQVATALILACDIEEVVLKARDDMLSNAGDV